ncbi:uncharacterized protein [Montipora capricornis]|uniref:uncharacterized protein n=1 Tax=Montipora capricornis TaxID=246305 RepID=UPI0035F1E167
MTLTRLSLCVLISMVLELYGQSVRTTFGYNCHEYTVYKLTAAERPKWNQSKNLCSESGSHLVCIEDQKEIGFLAQKLIELKLESEYFIGFEKQNEKWTWICNRNTVVTPKKIPWADHQPSNNGRCAKMYFSDKGLVYDDIPCSDKKDYICERRNSSCHKEDEPDIREKETVKPTTIHTLPDTSVATDSVVTTRQQHEGDSTSSSTFASNSGKPEGEKDSTTVKIAAALGAVLFIVLVVLVVVVLLRRKRRLGKNPEKPTANASSTKQPDSQYESVQPVDAARLLGAPEFRKESPTKVECEYAVVNKANKKPNKGDLVYAQLADFDDADNDVKMEKPTLYEPTVYADVVPSDVYLKESNDTSDPTYANVQTTGV